MLLLVATVILLLTAKVKIIIEYRDGKPKVVFKSFFLSYTLNSERLNRISKKKAPDKKVKAEKNEDSEETEDATVEGFMEKVEKAKENPPKFYDFDGQMCYLFLQKVGVVLF